MPVGRLTREEYEREINSGKTQPKALPLNDAEPPAEIEPRSTPGRSEGDVNVPDSLRKIIGEDALLNGRASAVALAESFGISPSSVSAYANGASSTATYNKPKSSILEHLNKSRVKAITRASKTLNGALSAITQEKLDYTDAKDLSMIAKNMSAVIKDLTPQEQQQEQSANGTMPKFVIFAPQFRKEDSFDVIDIKE